MDKQHAFPCSMGTFLAFLLAGCSLPPSSNNEAETKLLPPGSGLTVEIHPGSGIYASRGLQSVILRFHNAGPDTVFILKPLDGSANDWHMPYYRLTVRRADQQPLKLGPRCGNSGLWSDTRWPQDYLVELKPGAHFDEELALPCMVEQDGLHTVAFEYTYQPTDEQFTPPASAWRGSVKASEVVLNLKRQ